MASGTFQKTETQTPDIGRVAIVVAPMTVGIEPFGAHVSTGPHEGVARSEGACKNRAHSKVSNFYFLSVI